MNNRLAVSIVERGRPLPKDNGGREIQFPPHIILHTSNGDVVLFPVGPDSYYSFTEQVARDFFGRINQEYVFCTGVSTELIAAIGSLDNFLEKHKALVDELSGRKSLDTDKNLLAARARSELIGYADMINKEIDLAANPEDRAEWDRDFKRVTQIIADIGTVFGFKSSGDEQNEE